MTAPNDAKLKALIGAFVIGYFPFLINGWLYANTKPSVHVFWIAEIIYWVILPSAIFTYLIKYQSLTWRDLGIHQRIQNIHNPAGVLFLCLLFACFSYTIYQSCISLTRYIVSDAPGLFSYTSMQSKFYLYKLLSALFFAATAAIVEELYYRGLLYKIIESFNYHKIIYLVFSPLLFALAHWEQGVDGLISNLMFGFIFCLFYMKLRNLWPLITGHFIVDYIYFS